MKSPFRSAIKVTQPFGGNHTLTINGKQIKASTYYGQWGLKGHEGIDLIPNGTSWDILALADGVVVLDDDIAGPKLSDPYGKIVTIWHPALNKATMYCHLNINWVKQGETVKKGQVIGQMGSTGNSTGAHLHLNLFETDANGIRLNKKNGYNGGIDPLPFLQNNGIANDVIPTNTPPAGSGQPPLPTFTDQTKIPLGEHGELEIQAIRGKLSDLKRLETEANNLSVENIQLKADLKTCKAELKPTYTPPVTPKTTPETSLVPSTLLSQLLDLFKRFK